MLVRVFTIKGLFTRTDTEILPEHCANDDGYFAHLPIGVHP